MTTQSILTESSAASRTNLTAVRIGVPVALILIAVAVVLTISIVVWYFRQKTRRSHQFEFKLMEGDRSGGSQAEQDKGTEKEKEMAEGGGERFTPKSDGSEEEKIPH